MLIAPGPRVADTTAARPVTRPYISAMNAAACSCRVSTYRMVFEAASACTKRMFSSPGYPEDDGNPLVFQALDHQLERLYSSDTSRWER